MATTAKKTGTAKRGVRATTRKASAKRGGKVAGKIGGGKAKRGTAAKKRTTARATKPLDAPSRVGL
jgi:hypothetical protein